MKVIKRVNKNQKYVSKKNGKEYTSTNYYIELENGLWVAITPVFSNGYTQLDSVAETIING